MTGREDIILRMIGRNATAEEQRAALDDWATRGGAAVDLSDEVREAIVLVECASTDRHPRDVDFSHIYYWTRNYWGLSYSVRVANESYHLSPRQNRYLLAQQVSATIKDLESRDLVVRSRPKRNSAYRFYRLTEEGQRRAEALGMPDRAGRSRP